MKTIFPVLILLLLSVANADNIIGYSSVLKNDTTVLSKAPEFYMLDWKVGTNLISRKTDLFIEINSIGKQEINILVNQDKEPVLYTANISTPVCADGECKLMNIKFYWTLLGEYAGFDRYNLMPLTKYDHDEFLQEDYQKLHELLADDKSLMGRRTIDQLVEKPKMRTVNGVDAVSGATITRVKESVVSGALYSCYTAWRLVHGAIQEEIKANTLSILTEEMTVSMLYSRNQEYQIFALNNIDDVKYKEHFSQMAEVLKTSTPLVRSIIAKRITSKFKDAPELQKPFWEAFDKIDSGSRSLLVKYLNDAPHYVSVILSSQLDVMSKNQLRSFLNHLSTNKGKANSEVLDNLKIFSNSETTYAYLVKGFIEETE